MNPNNMLHDSKIELAKKLSELSKRGDSGERDNASRQLEAVMKKYGITDDMLEHDIKKQCEFVVVKEQMQFMRQVIASVCGKIPVYGVRGEERKKKQTLVVEITNSQFIEISEKFIFFWDRYHKDLELFYSAFIQRNELYTKPDPNAESQSSDKSVDEIIAMVSMMRGLEKHTITKKITES